MIGIELSIVFLLIVLNGVFAMSEMAIVSSRRPRLAAMAEAGDRGAAAALRLKDDPGRFLSVVQVGITLIGILAGAFSGATLAAKLGDWLDGVAWIATYGHSVAFGLVVIAITYASPVIGELAPKRIALVHADAIAARLARPLAAMAAFGRPFVMLLGASAAALLRLAGVREDAARGMTAEEMKTVIAEGAEAGVIDLAGRDMMTRLLRLADRPVAGIMTPRRDVAWVDIADDPATVREELKTIPYSRIVVIRDGNLDEPLGIVQTKDLLVRVLSGASIDIAEAMRQPLFLPDRSSILDALEAMKRSPVHIAFVVDEFGGFEGMLTLTDIVEAIAGDLTGEYGEVTPSVTRRSDGSYLVEGSATIDEVEAALGLSIESEGRFHTVAGLVLDLLKRIPNEGDAAELGDWRIEVLDTDMGGRRIDKVLFSRRVS
ncbi:MAG: HlyC/CorC family transporter [Alphaproteobacteria bacterium]|nr:HlyC/CorC family transporter [Alphaproteobacteria bacterium]